jgi:hypothetical protein
MKNYLMFSYSKEDEELHKRLIENTQKDYYNKIKEMETKEVCYL